MSEECTHDCSTCGANCSSREKKDMHEAPNKHSNIKHVIGVMSGKGGVGKSLVTSMLAVLLQKQGYRVGIMDADITGPSIPKAFGMKDAVIEGGDDGFYPPESTTGIQIISANLLLEDEEMPIVWRGPIIAGTVKQFWQEAIWRDVDYLLIDCPPGTGDVPLTVFQTIALDGIIIVSTPQDLVSMIVSKAANMAGMMNIPVIGLVENMSYVKCPECGKEYNVFGNSHIDETAEKFGYKVLSKIPLDTSLTELCDKGHIEMLSHNYMDGAVEEIMARFF